MNRSWCNCLRGEWTCRSRVRNRLRVSWWWTGPLNCRQQSWIESGWWFGASWGRMRLSWRLHRRGWSLFLRQPCSVCGWRWLRSSWRDQGIRLQNNRLWFSRTLCGSLQLQTSTKSWTRPCTLDWWFSKSSIYLTFSHHQLLGPHWRLLTQLSSWSSSTSKP